MDSIRIESGVSPPSDASQPGLRRFGARIGQREIGVVLLTVLVWLSSVGLPIDVVSPDLDSSWSRALGVALHSRMQFGSDLVFTFGPLGYMESDTYDPDLFRLRVLAWEIGFGLLSAAVVVWALLRVRGILERTLAFGVIVVVAQVRFSYGLLVLTASSTLLLDRPGRRAGWIAALTFVLATLSLVKFTLCAASLGCLGAIVVGRWIEGERRIAIGAGAAFCVWFLLLWTACGQSPAGLPLYFLRSARIASGYSEGLATETTARIERLGFLALAMLAALVLVLVASRRPRPVRLAAGLCLAISAFVAFKAGFVRASDHTPFFFAFVVVAGFLLPTPEELPPWRRAAATLARIGLAVSTVSETSPASGPASVRLAAIAGNLGWRLEANARAVADPGGFRRARDADLLRNELDYRLPRTRAEVGSEPIDMISSEQGYLFLNGLSWRPRPVFQGYCAFDPELLAMNARFLESARAPTYLLFRLESIDLRLQTMDDGLALQTIVRDWRPVLLEKGLLLLRHAPRDDAADPPRVVLERRVGFGEEVAMPSDGAACHILSLDVRYSLLGRIVETLYHAPEVRMRVKSDTGETSEWRIVPGMMRTGAIVDPWLPNQASWIDWSAGRPVARTSAVTVVEPQHPWMYSASIGLRLIARSALVPAATPEFDAAVSRPPFRTPPASIDAALPCIRETVDGEEVLVAHAPSDIRFELPPGDHIVRGHFGMAPRSWVAERTDGAAFHLLLEEEGSRRLLLDRRLDPRRRLPDRCIQEFEVRFETARRAELHFVATPGAKGDGSGDWTYWGSVEIEGLSGG